MLSLRLRQYWHRRQADATLQTLWQSSNKVRLGQYHENRYLAVDLETTALNPDEGEVVSIAWVPLENGQIDMGQAGHFLLSTNDSVGHSATFHHIRDCDLGEALSVSEVMPLFFEALKGRVLIFHCAAMDMAFLDQWCVRLHGARLLMPFVDTLTVERKRLDSRQPIIRSGELRLGQCRKRYNLPEYPPHNAMSDALATAELFLAMMASKRSV
ncbi:3'-5' exonuclease [Zhongshania sp.]|uniref:3'-5' exonuclease n=1 Tax=Zhongshania sp. TaxID=1971902 RepID=UPI001B7BA531|nr:3'-5' exonuclease [Zhongshania sp.]MBQ0797627.1 3'-5' exonuclease [Zhongshania sp.]